MPSDDVPYGPEWEAEIMRMRKVDLVDMVRRACTKEKNGSSHNTASTPCSRCGSTSFVIGSLRTCRDCSLTQK